MIQLSPPPPEINLSGPATMMDTRLETGLESPEDAIKYEYWLDTMQVFPDETKCCGTPKTMHEHSRCLSFKRADPYDNQVRLSQVMTGRVSHLLYLSIDKSPIQ